MWFDWISIGIKPEAALSRSTPLCLGGAFAEQAAVVGREVTEVMKSELASRIRNGDERIRFQPGSNGVQAETIEVHDRPETIPFIEGEPEGPVTRAEFPAKVDRAERFAESGSHEFLGTTDQPGSSG